MCDIAWSLTPEGSLVSYKLFWLAMIVIWPLARGYRHRSPIGGKTITALHGIDLYLHVKVYN
jgi:hypothetical protein